MRSIWSVIPAALKLFVKIHYQQMNSNHVSESFWVSRTNSVNFPFHIHQIWVFWITCIVILPSIIKVMEVVCLQWAHNKNINFLQYLQFHYIVTIITEGKANIPCQPCNETTSTWDFYLKKKEPPTTWLLINEDNDQVNINSLRKQETNRETL